MMAAPRRRLAESIQLSLPPAAHEPTPAACATGSRCAVRTMIENRHNYQRTAPPARVMFYRCGSWIDFPGRVAESLRRSFVERRPVADLVIDGSLYLFDFLRMLQTDFESGNQRSIAWIDDAGSCFFPKSFVDGSDEILPKRKREGPRGEPAAPAEEDEVSSSNDKLENESKRRHVALIADDCPKKSPLADYRLLGEGEGIYLSIKNCFLTGLKSNQWNATVTSIRQCELKGELGRSRFNVFHKQSNIVKASRGARNIVYAWFGASKKLVDSILAHGFGVPGSINDSGSYGLGVYFSSMGLPHLSAAKSEVDDNGEKHVVLCRVILGNGEKVECGSKQSHPSTVEFDTGVDDPSNPKWYVVWGSNVKTHVLPEFVVSFKTSEPVKGPANGATCVKRSIVELFSRIRNALPPTKVQEMENLYSVFKAGQLAKDMFTKQLRSIAGDAVLLSTIREIRGSGC